MIFKLNYFVEEEIAMQCTE